jgi:CubicO group peptidase (beta-lactamase class C family)
MSERLARVRGWLEKFVAAGEIAGGAVAAARGGEQAIEIYVGEAAPGRAAGAGTLWPLASISKSYTAAMVMAAVERGYVTLSTRVCEIFPEFKEEDREAINLRHLLTHTSGLIYESPQMEERLKAQTPMEEILREAYSGPLLFAPGTGLSYSDYGYGLAGWMAAAAVGRPFAELVREWVLEPAGLRDTFMPPPLAEHGRLAYVKGPLAEGTPGAMYNSPYALGLAHPSFGTVATANDLLRFGLLFAPGGKRRIHSGATIRAMTTDQTGGRAPGMMPGFDDPAGPPLPWGIGFSIQVPHARAPYGDLAPVGTAGHGGASGCRLIIDLADDIVIGIVTNTHAREGRERWMQRLDVVSNGVMAALT